MQIFISNFGLFSATTIRLSVLYSVCLVRCSRRIDFYAVQTEKLAYFYVKYESDWLTNFNFGILLRKEEISAVSINGQIDLVLKAGC
ncbi:hypothetical protein T09_3423 [Trichinella sp. T9]|nr:hypothetical protein T09_3423 [Trichinella sp. T9]